MCGIIGYIGDKNIIETLIGGLKKLEYRGYDSAGVCVKEKDGLVVLKKKGRVEELEKEINPDNFSGHIGIAHTRWATHGQPNETNAHPHLDCKGEIAVVHNGIIENYHALREFLEKEGHVFRSETDTEVVSHLIEKFYSPASNFGQNEKEGHTEGEENPKFVAGKGDLQEAVLKSLKLIEGTFGLAIIHKNEDKIVIAKRGSPIVIGLANNEIIAASDLIPILPFTNRVIYLNDDEIAVMERGKFLVRGLNGEEINKTVKEVKMAVSEIEKGGFKHFMLKEIYEQPSAVLNTLRGRIKDDKIKLSISIDTAKINRIIITACGTSWHSALIGKYFFEKYTGIPTEVDYASELRYRNPVIKEGDLVVVISQSGETADTLAALKEVKKRGAKTFGIINTVGSTISREVDSGIYLHAGPEIGVASTKAFTCQVMALLLFSLFIKQQNGQAIDAELLKSIQEIPSKILTVLKNTDEIKKIAEKYKDTKNFLYLGRGFNFPVALEGALKLKEISYIHAEGYPAAEMKHGPIALIDENMPVVFLSPKDSTYEKIISNMQEVKARGGNIIAITNEDDERLKTLAKEIIKIPMCEEELEPLLSVIPLQLLAYYIADFKGINVDKPRNLAKSVTVE